MQKVIGVHGGMYEIDDDWKKPLHDQFISKADLEFFRTATTEQLLNRVAKEHYTINSQLVMVFEIFYHGRIRAAAELARALVKQRSFFETTLRNSSNQWANALLETATEDLPEQF